MKTTAFVLVCDRDAELLPVFVRRWREIHPDTPLAVLKDIKSGEIDTLGLPTYSLRWLDDGTPMAPAFSEDILRAVRGESCEAFLKLDIDVFHSGEDWWSEPLKEFGAVGFQHAQGEDWFYGAAYGMRADALEILVRHFRRHGTVDILEDVGISRGCRAAGVSVRHIADRIVGTQLSTFTSRERYQGLPVVHCGQYGHSPEGRSAALEIMEILGGDKPTRKKVDLRKYFSGAYVLNMASRPDRWESFHLRAARAGIQGFERYEAIEGSKAPAPAWWRSGNGAWGCMMSHLRLAQDALMKGFGNYLVFEDDVCFSEDFAERLPEVMKEVDQLEGDWDMLYLGGQHLYKETSPPWPHNGSVNLLRCNNVNRTHALAVNARFMVKFAQHILHAPDYLEAEKPLHIDHQLGNLHRSIVTLAAHPWLCGQAGGVSDINAQDKPEEWWNSNGWERGEL